MDKIYSISGSWNVNYSCSNSESRFWDGNIILYDDYWFEGVVNEQHNFYNGEKFVFGVFLPDKSIELISLISFNIENPIIYIANKIGKDYSGEFSFINPEGKLPFGAFDMKISNILNGISYEDEVEILKKYISNCLLNSCDNDTKKFYDKMVRAKKTLIPKFIEISNNVNSYNTNSDEDRVPNILDIFSDVTQEDKKMIKKYSIY